MQEDNLIFIICKCVLKNKSTKGKTIVYRNSHPIIICKLYCSVRVFIYPEDMDCLKLDLLVEATGTMQERGMSLPGTDEVITAFMFEFLLF